MEPMSPKNNSTTADRFPMLPALPSSECLVGGNSANQDFCIFGNQLMADKLCSVSCMQRYVSALAAAAELQREPGLARAG